MNYFALVFFFIIFCIAIYILIREGMPRTYCYSCDAIMYYDNKRRVWVHPNNGCDCKIPVGVIK